MAALAQTLLNFMRAPGARSSVAAVAALPAASVSCSHTFAESDLARLHRLESGGVDEPTWQGMLMAPYFERLTAAASIFGKQQLYRDLRHGLADEERAALVTRLTRLEEPPGRQALEPVLAPLRAADTELSAMLFEARLPLVPAWAGKCWLLFAGLSLSVAAVAWSPLAWLAALFFLFQMVTLQARYHSIIDVWDRQRASLQLLLRTCSLAAGSAHPALAAFAALGRQAGRYNRALNRSPLQSLSIVGAYLDWFLQANVEHYFRSVRLVRNEQAFLQQCFHLCARLDADFTLARHRADSATCWAQHAREVRLHAAVHPLLAAPLALSITLNGGGAFISGQNGVGKSTLLRTVGINLLTARAFGFCYAASAQCPMSAVWASMQSEDSLLGGASLYVAELQRARELLKAAAQGGDDGAIFIIDEIFRGTNHLESVSSAAAVVDELAFGHMVLVSSHNLVLGSLLAHRLTPLCVARDEGGALVLRPGLLNTTNGIALLAQHGFGGAIDAKARSVFAWLETFLARPPGGAALLAQWDRAA
ncbi:MutS-related protein [Massilia sp. PWRC2]|uniref:MutS-related protein n=1 Tax=Massilia sp. PWRC2 TaxID=2804626 RepID=UPI003CF72BDE